MPQLPLPDQVAQAQNYALVESRSPKALQGREIALIERSGHKVV